jgi:multiple sugar transport system substrate-binding protein
MRLRLESGRQRPGARRRSVSARLGIASAGAAALCALAACGGSVPAAANQPAGAAEPASAAATGSPGGAAGSANCKPGATRLTFWAWATGYNLAVDKFNATHPDICVTLENDGATNVEYTKIQDAEKAGSGAPDVAEMEYFVLPSFEITKSLANLVPYGVNAYQKNEVPAAWAQVSQGGGVYAMPVDVGPLALYYNSSVLSKYGLAVPKTWTQYATEAASLKKRDPGATLGTVDWTDDQPVLALMQQYGAFPFQWHGGAKLTIDFTGKAETSFADYWQKQIGTSEVNHYPDFSPGQWAAWDNETVVSRFSPAWGPVGMQLSTKKTLGDWRAAPLPQVTAGQVQSGNWGGSTIAVLASSKYARQAAEFAEWFGGSAASWQILSGPVAGAYPGYEPLLDSPAFLAQTLKISGSQHFQGVFAQAAENMTAPDWPPIMNEVNDIWPTVFAGVSNGTETLPAAFGTLQADLVKYAQAQGFTVTP